MRENQILTSVKDLRKTININTFSAALVATIFGCTGPVLNVIGGAKNAGLAYTETISWVFAIYFFSGLLGIFLALKYRQPISGAGTLPGAVLVAGSLTHFTLNEAIGAYLAANLIVLIFGASGFIDKVMRWIPIPIVMGMIVGVMIRFAKDMITSISISPILAGSAIIAFLLSSCFLKKVPPVLTALMAAVLLAVFRDAFDFHHIQYSFTIPHLIMPAFSPEAIMSIGIPLALLIISSENAQASGVLMLQGYKPPNSAMAIYGSIVGLMASLFGGHATNIAGTMTAICSAKEVGKKDSRYAASVLNGVLFASFGLFASLVVPFVIAMPSVIVNVIAGLAMLGILISSLKTAFSGSQFQTGAFFSLIIGISGITFLNISAPLWSILGGLLVSFLIENEHFLAKSKALRMNNLEEEANA